MNEIKVAKDVSKKRSSWLADEVLKAKNLKSLYIAEKKLEESKGRNQKDKEEIFMVLKRDPYNPHAPGKAGVKEALDQVPALVVVVDHSKEQQDIVLLGGTSHARLQNNAGSSPSIDTASHSSSLSPTIRGMKCLTVDELKSSIPSASKASATNPRGLVFRSQHTQQQQPIWRRIHLERPLARSSNSLFASKISTVSHVRIKSDSDVNLPTNDFFARHISRPLFSPRPATSGSPARSRLQLISQGEEANPNSKLSIPLFLNLQPITLSEALELESRADNQVGIDRMGRRG